MSEPITPEQLASLVAAIDAAAEERGWNNGHLLVKVEDTDVAGEGELGLKEFTEHPTELLFGFTAPDEWVAMGVCTEGWAAPIDSCAAGGGTRPSKAKGRTRIRTTVLVSRDGLVASGMRTAGVGFEVMPEPVGTVPDAVRRALRLPTAPPELAFTHWVAILLFHRIVGDGGDKRNVGWAQLRPVLEHYEAVATEGSWEFMRTLAAKRPDVQPDLAPEVAAWMDDGMFSRWVLGGLPSYDYMLERARKACTAEAWRQVRVLLKSWGLRSFVRKKRVA